MSFGRYAWGLALLLVVVGAACFGAGRWRRRALPEWSGAPARLAEAMAALGIVLGVAELLGIVGLLRSGSLVVGCVLAGGGVGIAPWPRRAPRAKPPAPAPHPLALALALAVAVLALAHWTAGSEPAFTGGMTGPDTLGYHGPIAATIVQRASIVHPPYVYTDPAVAFFPASAELVHAIGMLLFGRDVLSPVINLGWLGLGLLAGWCLGRPRGAGPASLIATTAVLDVPAFSTSQPGSADNDIVALALLLTALALLFNAFPGRKDQPDHPPGAVVLAGIAAGLALATKVTMFAPVGLLGIAVLIALPGRWSRTRWALGLVGASIVWLARNAIAFGNPVPAVGLALPSPRIPAQGLTVGDYLFDGARWQHVFLPGLHAGLTVLWPVLLAAALIGAIAALARGPAPLERLLGAVALLAAGAYIVTPRTGFPLLFAINLRYLGPALLIGVALLFRLPRASDVLRRPWAAGLLAAGLIVDLLDRGPGPFLLGYPVLGPRPHFGGTTAMWVGLVLAAGLAAWTLSRRRVAVPGAMVLVSVAVIGLIGWPAERRYVRTRYTTGPLAFARSLHHQRIAVVGFLQPYPAYGLDLSNPVVEVSHHGPHGAQPLVGSCREWRRDLSAGRYAYVITSGPYGLLYPSAPDYAAWTRSDPAATLLGATPDGLGGQISVFRLAGPMHPQLCV